jgi:hypothetical protein
MQGGVWTWSSISTQVGSYFFFYVSFGRIPFFKKNPGVNAGVAAAGLVQNS